MKVKDPADPCCNCRHIGEIVYTTSPPACFYCKEPEFAEWELN